MRNLGDSRNAGEFVKREFGDIGSAGGHRAMAKAVAPTERFEQKFGSLDPERIQATTHELAERFLREPLAAERRRASARG